MRSPREAKVEQEGKGSERHSQSDINASIVNAQTTCYTTQGIAQSKKRSIVDDSSSNVYFKVKGDHRLTSAP